MIITPKDPRLNPAMAARVEAARRAWNSRPVNGNSKVFASFDKLLDAYTNDCVRFSDIGVALGISRERARQLWNNYFAHLFRSGKTGHQRQRACTIASRRERIATLAPAGTAADAAREAKRNGCTVAASRGSGHNAVTVRRRSLLVNGHECRVLVSRHANHKPAGSLVGYYHFHNMLARRKPAFVILICGLGDAAEHFIMPLAIYQSWNGNVGRSRYVPERPNTYVKNAHLGQTDWIWQYRDAWHLLK